MKNLLWLLSRIIHKYLIKTHKIFIGYLWNYHENKFLRMPITLKHFVDQTFVKMMKYCYILQVSSFKVEIKKRHIKKIYSYLMLRYNAKYCGLSNFLLLVGFFAYNFSLLDLNFFFPIFFVWKVFIIVLGIMKCDTLIRTLPFIGRTV